jgi:hypothetical protein
MRPLLIVTCLALPTGPQATPSLDGDWRAVELRTSKGTAELQNDSVVLNLDGGMFQLVMLGSHGSGKTVIDAKAGRLDLVGEKESLYGTYTMDGDTLTLALWGTAADRQAKPSTDKGGMVFVFQRQKKKMLDR